tara:strand:- start:339 stop:743 length:405 start_codon:yes stop_codon:yes gene_type:complete
MATKKAITDVAQKLNITARKGDTFRLAVTFNDSSNNAITVGAYTYRMQVRNSPEDDSAGGAIIDIATTQDSPIVEGFDTSGSPTLVINIAASTMAGIDGGRYVYDLEATSTSGSLIQTWLKGNFVVNEDVTVNS